MPVTSRGHFQLKALGKIPYKGKNMQSQSPTTNFLRSLRQRWYMLLVCLLITGTVAVIYRFSHPSLYSSSVTIGINPPAELANTAALIQSEAEILRSQQLVEKAIEQLNYEVVYYKNNLFVKEEVLSQAPFEVEVTAAANNPGKATYGFRYDSKDAFVLISNAGAEVKRYAYGTEINTGGNRFIVRKREHVSSLNTKDQSWSFEIFHAQTLATLLLENCISVVADGSKSNVLKLHVKHPVPEKARELANAMAGAFMNQRQSTSEKNIGNAAAYIDSKMMAVGQHLDSARSALNQFREQNTIVNLPLEAQSSFGTLNDLEMRKINLGMQLNVLEKISDHIRKEKEIHIPLNDYSDEVNNYLSGNIQQLNAAIRAKNTVNTGGSSNVLPTIDAEINTQRAALLERIALTRRRLILQQDELLAAIEQQKSSFSELPKTETRLQDLMREVALYEKIYNHLLDKKTELMVNMPVNTASADLITAAILPLKPTEPNHLILIFLTIFSGVTLGLISVQISRRVRPAVNVPEDLTPLSRIPVIGQIHQLKKNETAYQPFIALATRIMMNRPTEKSMVITVTSTHKGEGKSFIAAQLARTMAAQDKKVLLLDMNTIQPRLGEWFSARRPEGISDVFTRHLQIQDVVQLTSIPNLDLITSGIAEHPVGHLAATTRTREILDDLRTQYDAIIVDTPEVGEYIDAIPFMKWSDLNLYVVRAESGKDALVSHAEVVKEEYRLQEVYYVLNAMKSKRNHSGFIQQSSKTSSLPIHKWVPRLTNLFM